MKKSTRVYIGPLSGGVIGGTDQNYVFQRGVPVELPEDLAKKLEREKRDDWALPQSECAKKIMDEEKKIAEIRAKEDAEIAAKAELSAKADKAKADKSTATSNTTLKVG
jgi:hypothetical protein